MFSLNFIFLDHETHERGILLVSVVVGILCYFFVISGVSFLSLNIWNTRFFRPFFVYFVVKMFFYCFRFWFVVYFSFCGRPQIVK